MLLGIDGRSATARRYRDIAMALADDLGGSDKLSEPEQALVRQAAALSVKAEEQQAAIVRGDDIDPEQLVRLTNSLTRIMGKLGIRRARRERSPIPSLADLARRHAHPASEA
jgi:hypothetical protein